MPHVPPDGEPTCTCPTCPGCEGVFPIEPGKTGQRFFVIDEKGQVKQATSAAFTDATPIQ